MATLSERLLRRALHAYFRVSRGLTLGVRAAVFDREGRVFLVRHTYVRGWYLPGGGVEAGEDALTALARELAEEGNIELTAPPVLHGVYWNRTASPRDHVLLYVARAFRQGAPRGPDREIAETGFFAPDDLPAATTPATRARLDEILRGAPVSPLW
ncbi:NUDIX domain-containing protein [Camelimonas abortus]|uniref:NUDIX domain-containing protein n=1 Tax=Camelimonas abortus TaxID=1017184 RepID=A0ABV7LIG1_9HYPH